VLNQGQADAEHVETRVHDPQPVESFQKLGHRADAERFRLLRDHDGIAGGDDIPGDAEKSGGGVEQAKFKATAIHAAQKGAHSGEMRPHAASAGFVIAGLAAGDKREGIKPGGTNETFHGNARIRQIIIKSG
jgi:hypothetical protein